MLHAVGLVLGAPAEPGSEPAVLELSAQEQVLFQEVQHLTAALAPTLWADWPSEFPPFILRTRGHKIMIGHPHPPADFIPLAREHGVWARPNNDTTDVQATYPVNGVVTAVMSAPRRQRRRRAAGCSRPPHGCFTPYQGSARIRDPFVGKFAGYDDLSFPYPYEDPNQTAALRLEAEVVFQLATADPNDATSVATKARLLPLLWRIQRALSSEAAFQEYKLMTEWSEGVARYTERELARLAATPTAIDRHPRSRGRFLRPVTTTSLRAVW